MPGYETDRFSVLLWLALAACGGDAPQRADEGGSGDDGAADDASDDDASDDDAARPARELDGGRTRLDASSVPPGRDVSVEAGAGTVAGDAGDAGAQMPPGRSACAITATSARCNAESVVNVGVAGDPRRVYWARPATAAPEQGYPVVVLYQGSYFGPATTWDLDITRDMAFGGFYQVQLVAELLEHGFVVVQPEAQNGTFWSTNLPFPFASSSDGVFIPLLLQELAKGTFSKLDLTHLYAAGISSGGYMTSRMAVSFAGRFRALAIQSGSYATCAGPSCSIPATLPSDHPPTLFLHGAADTIVPIGTAEPYFEKLKSGGFDTRFERSETAGHEWLPTSPAAIVDWFTKH